MARPKSEKTEGAPVQELKESREIDFSSFSNEQLGLLIEYALGVHPKYLLGGPGGNLDYIGMALDSYNKKEAHWKKE